MTTAILDNDNTERNNNKNSYSNNHSLCLHAYNDNCYSAVVDNGIMQPQHQ